MKQQGFTIIELVVAVAIVSALSLVIAFSVTQYANRGRDANVAGNLAVLVPAGEAYYNIENVQYGDGYTDFCTSTAVSNIFAQLALPNPVNNCSGDPDHPGLCCTVSGDGDEWAACAQQFVIPVQAFCVDSRGVKRSICNSSCEAGLTQCPEDTLSACE